MNNATETPIISDDGYYVWDGQQWQLREQAAPAIVVEHDSGTVSIEGDQVVARFFGTARKGFRQVAWENPTEYWALKDVRDARVKGSTLIIDIEGETRQMFTHCQTTALSSFVEAVNRGEKNELPEAEVFQMAGETVTYPSVAAYQRDASLRHSRGYHEQVALQTQQKVAVGRTLAKGVLTGGAGLLLTGRAKKGGEIVVTWRKS